ncbi:hypothetical protein HCH52_11140 [Oscillospiraceae bacterium HV4-5-C5C]|nr:hypothetical protein [Oscillospiraceae bacterium HV4-5-C5C]
MEAALKNTAYGQRCLMVAQKNAGIKILIEGDAQAIQQPGTVFRLAADIQPLNQKVVYRPAAYWSEGVFYYVRISHERQLILQADHQTSLKLSLRQNMEKMRYWLARAYISILGQQNGNLAAAMLIGWDQGLSEADKEIFRLAGLSHLLVVSGSNVTMLLQLLTPQTGLWPFRGRRIRVLQILLIISYGYLCAFDPSVSRAVAAQILGLTAVLLRRPYNQTDLTAKSALLTLLLAPSLAWSWGFRMSLSISILLTIVQKRGRLNRRCRPEPGSMTERLMWRFNLPLGSYRFINLLTETLRAQLIAAVAIIPFETAFAAEVSALSGLINLIAIPLAEVLSVYLFILVPWIGSAAAIPPLCLLLQRSLGAGLNLLQCLAAQAGRYPELLFRHDSQLQTAAFAGLIIIVAVACLDWLRVNPAVMDAQILC